MSQETAATTRQASVTKQDSKLLKKDVPRINIIHLNETNSTSNSNNNNNSNNNDYNSTREDGNGGSGSRNKLTVDKNLLSLHDPAISKNMKNNNTNKKNKKNKLQNPCKLFRRAIPVMPKPLAIICCIANIFIPGSGTLISAFSILCCGTKHRYKNNILAFFINFLAFLLQLCSACVIFGWIWSIKYGIFMVHLADNSQDEIMDTDLPNADLYCRRHSSVDTTVLMYQPTKPRLSITINQLKEEENKS